MKVVIEVSDLKQKHLNTARLGPTHIRKSNRDRVCAKRKKKHTDF